MKLYSIHKWGELFENNRSRTVVNLGWVSVPNRHDGENYTKIVTYKDGAEIFAAWNLMIQVASKCHPRGFLIKDSGEPHTALSLSIKTRAPVSWFENAFSFLTEQTDWLNCQEVDSGYQPPDRIVTANCNEGKEGNRTEGREKALPKEVEIWNANCGSLPKVMSVNDERLRHLRSRRQDAFWVSNLDVAIRKAATSGFCAGKNDRGWKADFDWILQPNTVAKIMEGKYDARSTTASKGNRQSVNRNDGTLNNPNDYAGITQKL